MPSTARVAVKHYQIRDNNYVTYSLAFCSDKKRFLQLNCKSSAF